MRLLIVDDHEVVRRGVRSLLAEQANWDVCGEGTVCRGGNENCELVSAHEGNRAGLIADSEVFGDVHGCLFRPSWACS